MGNLPGLKINIQYNMPYNIPYRQELKIVSCERIRLNVGHTLALAMEIKRFVRVYDAYIWYICILMRGWPSFELASFAAT